MSGDDFLFTFILANAGSIFVGAILLVIIILALRASTKKGKTTGCSCGCDQCPSSAICHGEKEQ